MITVVATPTTWTSSAWLIIVFLIYNCLVHDILHIYTLCGIFYFSGVDTIYKGPSTLHCQAMCGETNCSHVDRVTGGLEPRASMLKDRRSVTPHQLKCVLFHVISRDVVTFIHCSTVVATVAQAGYDAIAIDTFPHYLHHYITIGIRR